eukprot:TRINITY_DN43560_c0_g1_i1.p1 TRINITY_DN43560_c0_g1~~TRINITY_DN43560_c0_g1_i1.p1  ORF type:complete len:1312 (+),score=100.06 TRINITY_DN43560_c0_g1_i1:454-3936(+)
MIAVAIVLQCVHLRDYTAWAGGELPNREYSAWVPFIFEMLWRPTWLGFCINRTLTILQIVSFAFYTKVSVVMSVAEQSQDKYLHAITCILTMCTYAARIYACPLVPRLRGSNYPRLLYATTDLLMLLDLVAVTPTVLDLATQHTFPHLLWLSSARLLDDLFRSRFGGVGVAIFRRLWTQNVGIFVISAYLFAFAWVIFATLFYLLERGNASLLWGVDPGFQRYKSIPGSLYFTLISFMGEFPNADDFTGWGKFVVVFVCFIGTALVDIPAGIVGYAFQMHVRETCTRRSSVMTNQVSLHGPGELRRGHRLDGPKHGWLTLMFALVSHIAFIGTTLREGRYTALTKALRWTECLVFAPFFLMDWALRLRETRRRKEYIKSFRHHLDFISFAPSLVLFYTLLYGSGTDYDNLQSCLHASTVVRGFKLDRFTGRLFAELNGIITDNKEIFILTFSMALGFWLAMTVLMYEFESTNPDIGTRKHFSSVEDSLWMTLLDFTGEVPVNDHTPFGKAVHTVIMLVGISIFSLPMGILGAALRFRLDNAMLAERGGRISLVNRSMSSARDLPEKEESITLEQVHADTQRDERDTCDADLMQLEAGSWKYKVHKFLLGSRHPTNASNKYVRITEVAIWLNIWVCTLCSMVETHPVALDHGNIRTICRSICLASVCCYLVEFIVRFACHPRRTRFVFSGCGLADIIAIFPTLWLVVYGWVCGPPTRMMYLVVSCMRIWRMASRDRFSHASQVLCDIVTARSRQLLQVIYALLAIWCLFTNLNWCLLRHDQTQEDGIYLSSRYGVYWQAMMYSLIHLSGDYPIVEYPAAAKLYHMVLCFLGFFFVALPAGLITAAFADAMKARRSILLERRLQACNRITRLLKRAVRLRRLALIVRQAQRQNEARRVMLANVRSTNSQLAIWFRNLEGEDHRKRLFITTLIYVLLVCVSTIEELGVRSWTWAILLSVFHVFFWYHFGMRLITSPVRATVKWPKLKFIMKARHFLLLLALLVWLLHLFFLSFGLKESHDRWMPWINCAQILLIFQLEDYIHIGRISSLVWTEMREVILHMIELLLTFWFLTSTVWFLSHRESGIGLDNMFTTMYYTSIFMLGEWCSVDFNGVGCFLCILYIFVGVAVSAMPMAALTDALTAIIEAKGHGFILAGKLDGVSAS